MMIQNLDDPQVVAAVCAAVDETTRRSNSMYKTMLVNIHTRCGNV